MVNKTPLMGLLELAALRRKHQLDQFFGNSRFESFGVPLVDAHHVGNDSAVLAVGIDVNLGPAGCRQQSPRWVGRILARAVIDVAGLCVYDLLGVAPRVARVFRSPGRGS